MNTLKTVPAVARRFVHDHKVALSVTVTALACLKLNRMALKDHDDFLKQHDLYETYYNNAEG